MHRYAQTIVQLQIQLFESGYSDEDQRRVADAYLLASDLFSGQFRGSGKTFVAHLVGTASILVAHRASLPLVVSGLLHAAYEQGDFYLGLMGRRVDRRREVQSVVGTEAEAYITAYSQFPWSDLSITSRRYDPIKATVHERDLLLIRLANELEDHLDFNIQFCKDGDQRLQRMITLSDFFTAMARGLGYPALAEELAAVFEANRKHRVPATLRGRHNVSFLQIPRSCTRRLGARLRVQLQRLRSTEP